MQTSNRYDNLDLKQLVDRISADYYHPVSKLVSSAQAKIEEVKKTDKDGQITNFTDACHQLLTATHRYIDYLNACLVPYISDLHRKHTEGHNCENCSGGCNMGHSSYLVTITDGHLQLTSMLYEVKRAAMPFHFNVNYPHIYRALRNDMLLIDNMLNELFHIEEAKLISGIIAAQKMINVPG